MATTGELQAIIEELQLIDAGDALSYFGEELFRENEPITMNLMENTPDQQREAVYD